MHTVTNDWEPILDHITATETAKKLRDFLEEEYQEHIIYPSREDIWNAFQWTPYSKVKVVILGQDPYHGEGQAHGLSFSVRPGVKVPPSLKNIYKELESDLDFKAPNHGYLKEWAKSGVLLMNTVMTVRAGQAHSHKNKGWEIITDAIIESLNAQDHPIVFLLWGKASEEKRVLIDEGKHVVLSASHPSPFSARLSFLGSKHFSRTNELLIQSNQDPIDWQLSEIIEG